MIRADDVVADDVLAEAERRLEAGDGRGAVDVLVDASSHADRPDLEVALASVRHRAAAVLGDAAGAPPAADAADPWLPGTIPEVGRDELTPELLATGLARHGSVLVRGLLAPAVAEGLLADVKRAMEAAEACAQGASAAETSPWYLPFEAGGGFSFGAIERGFARSLSSVLTVESPRSLAHVVAAFREAGVGHLLEGYFGEWPVLSAKKTTLRRASPASPTEWHQDGAFLGADTRSVNVWVALTPCGEAAPGIEVFPHAFDHIVETGTDDALFSWSVSPTRAKAMAVPEPVRPVFQAGDALLFNQMTLHRTDIQPTMTDDRYALESWFFAPSTYPYAQVPILF